MGREGLGKGKNQVVDRTDPPLRRWRRLGWAGRVWVRVKIAWLTGQTLPYDDGGGDRKEKL